MKHLVVGHLGSIGSRHYRLLKEAGEEVYGKDFKYNEPNLYPNVDMIWICTPEKFKRPYIECLSKDKKVFVEKPYGNYHEGNIWVACNYRFHSAVQVLKDNLHKVGEILYCRMHFSHYLPYQRKNWKEYIENTNIVMDAGWHFVDLALWLFGGKYHSNKVFNNIELEFNDFSKIMISHNNGIWTEINLDYIRRDKSWGITIVGKEGTLTLSCSGRNPEKVALAYTYKNDLEILFINQVHPDEMYRNQLNYLLKENWTSNIDQAMEVMNICG